MKQLMIDKYNQSEVRLGELVTQLRLATTEYDLEDTIREIETELINRQVWVNKLNEI